MTAIVDRRKFAACLAGREPAEALLQADRDRLVARLVAEQWSDTQIAAHTRMSTYTTARIRARIETEGAAP